MKHTQAQVSSVSVNKYSFAVNDYSSDGWLTTGITMFASTTDTQVVFQVFQASDSKTRTITITPQQEAYMYSQID